MAGSDGAPWGPALLTQGVLSQPLGRMQPRPADSLGARGRMQAVNGLSLILLWGRLGCHVMGKNP